MHRDLIRRKALLAASSVVFAAGLTACPTPKADEDTALADSATEDTSDGRPDCSEVDLSDTAEHMACYDALRTWCDASYGVDTQEASDCTWGPGTDGSTRCIPWGPPVPPRMRVRAVA